MSMNPFNPEMHARDLLTEQIMVLDRRAGDPAKARELLKVATLQELRELRDALLDERDAK